MNEFESIDHLNDVFTQGQFPLPEQIRVEGIVFHLSRSKSHGIPDMVNNGKKEFVVYAMDQSSRDKLKETSLKEWIIFIWAIDRSLSIRPARAVTNTAARAKSDMETGDHNLKEGNSNVIADTVQIKFIQFNKTIPGKTDTGANLSSLHCEEWRVLSGKNMVEFRSSILSDNTIRTELLDQVAIKTSEGSEYRPVIALDVNISGKSLKACKFNLNDRSQMQDKILIGQNILEKGKFLVDPNIQQDRVESVDWDALQEIYKDITLIKESNRTEKQSIDNLYQAMLECDVTMSDLAHHILIQEK